MSAQIPEKLGKYDILGQIGRGSMGVVYEGYDPYADEKVAIKVALSDALKDRESGHRYRKMFFNEAHTAGKLRHPNIISILDAGVDGDDCYIVMELVEGFQTIRTYCAHDSLLPVDEVVEIIFKCAKALDYAHRVGVIHRDIKPTNILLTREKEVKIGDFSIAHIVKSDTTNTLPMGFVGSPRYMSPEQVQEDNLTNQTDLFSLGIVMYEMLTGHHPFSSESFSRLIYKIINEKQPPLRTFRQDIPDILEKIVYHALQKDPSKRYTMGLNMAADLSMAFDYLDEPLRHINEEEHFNAVRALSFFQGFSDSEIWEILRACHWQEAGRGEEIIIEGDIDDSFYIIISGSVEVLKGGRKIGILHAGDCFGEMGYLEKAERTASIVAKEEMQIMKINATLIDQVSVSCQLHFSKVFLKTLVKRLSNTTAMVSSVTDDYERKTNLG